MSLIKQYKKFISLSSWNSSLMCDIDNFRFTVGGPNRAKMSPACETSVMILLVSLYRIYEYFSIVRISPAGACVKRWSILTIVAGCWRSWLCMRGDDLGIITNYDLKLKSVGDKSDIYVRKARDGLSSGLLVMSLDLKRPVGVCSFRSNPITRWEESSHRSNVMSVGRLFRSSSVIVHEHAIG